MSGFMTAFLNMDEIKALFNEGGWVPPPAAPKNLFATADFNQITLKWNKNSEADFLITMCMAIHYQTQLC